SFNEYCEPFDSTVMCVFLSHLGRVFFYLLNDCKINFFIVQWAIIINFMLGEIQFYLWHVNHLILTIEIRTYVLGVLFYIAYPIVSIISNFRKAMKLFFEWIVRHTVMCR